MSNLIFGFAGFAIGMFLMALMCAAGRADEESERMMRDEELRDYQRGHLEKDMDTTPKPNTIEIRHRLTDAVLWSGEADSLRSGLEKAVKAGADLAGADLWDACLRGANLRRADLAGADLADADLAGADLWDACLVGADLAGANLRDACLVGAKLDESTRIDTGETWGEYLTQTLPALLTDGGKSLVEFESHWECHEWDDNCPMAFAFDVRSEEDCPILLRPRVRQFVKFFDSKLIPWDAAGTWRRTWNRSRPSKNC